MSKVAKRFAEGTEVPVNKTRDELERLLAVHGATQRAIITDDDTGRARVQFFLGGRLIRLDLSTKRSDLPDPAKSNFQQKADCPQGWGGWATKRRQEWVTSKNDQFAREAWRRLLLVTKAKLELVADKTRSAEQEFLADIVLPDGGTLLEHLAPQLAASYSDGAMPPLLGSGR